MDHAYPNITLNSQQVREVAEWEVGKIYKIEITVQMRGVRKAESYDMPPQEIGEGTMPQNSVMVGDFKIIDAQAEVENPNDPETYEDDYEKVRGNKE